MLGSIESQIYKPGLACHTVLKFKDEDTDELDGGNNRWNSEWDMGGIMWVNKSVRASCARGKGGKELRDTGEMEGIWLDRN